MFFHNLIPQEGDRAQVIKWFGVDYPGLESFTRELENYQPAILHRDRPEKARLGITDRLDIPVCQFITENIGDTGVVRTSEQVTAIRGKYESLRSRKAKIELHQSVSSLCGKIFDVENTEVLLSVNFSHRR